LDETFGAILFWLGVLAALLLFAVGLPAAIGQGPGAPPVVEASQ
jgi:hypothetical protein